MDSNTSLILLVLIVAVAEITKKYIDKKYK
ncbi:hypothetical protein QOZ93_001521 [Hathewaya limosa]|uniref:Uncharacterized protein n=1 Tax=Hathewaya limosa TaxID=1536 RepID=A0ABU0JRR7_HATLI|nr:hypothetical protein [Hathewaya limosa]